MLRLFSNVRKTLINEGKTSRYVRYAVGEVLLIMVGILLALQVQTWNENRRLAQERRELIVALKVDFETTIDRLTSAISEVESNLDESMRFLRYAAGEEHGLSLDEAKTIGIVIFGVVFLEPTLTTYESAKSDGTIALIKNLELKASFAEFDKFHRLVIRTDQNRSYDYYTNSAYELRKRAGSRTAISHSDRFEPPQIFAQTELEYRKMLQEKDVYAAIENRIEFRINYREYLNGMRFHAQQILTALEALD